MLDFDLAALYQVETKRLNEQVKRNIERFPKEFMFRLTKKEWDTMRSQFAAASIDAESMRSQIATSSLKKRKRIDFPYAFTEHGVTMLASILRSEIAIKMNIAVVKAFIAYRKFVLINQDMADKLEQLRQELYGRLGEQDVQISQLYDAIENLLEENVNQQTWKDRERIGFKQ
jgi:phage regulator Rha-like protein